MPDRCWQRRAVSSWAGVTSTPVGRASRRASQAEKYAVPQPSWICSLMSATDLYAEAGQDLAHRLGIAVGVAAHVGDEKYLAGTAEKDGERVHRML